MKDVRDRRAREEAMPWIAFGSFLLAFMLATAVVVRGSNWRCWRALKIGGVANGDVEGAWRRVRLGQRLAGTVMCLHTLVALAVMMMSFNCRSCSLILLVSAFVIVPLQAVGCILGCVGNGLRYLVPATPGAAYPCGCCKSMETVLTASIFVNIISIFFLCVGVVITLGLRVVYGQDAVAVTLALCQVVVIGLLTLVSVMSRELSMFLKSQKASSASPC